MRDVSGIPVSCQLTQGQKQDGTAGEQLLGMLPCVRFTCPAYRAVSLGLEEL